jgi:hypothetical protein
MKNSFNSQKTRERERERERETHTHTHTENKTMIVMTPKCQEGGKKQQQSHSCSTLKEKHHEKRAKVIEIFLFCRSHK